MRAAQVQRLGEPPVIADVPEPERGDGQALVGVLAAPLNPIDLSIASGRFGGPPPLPHIPGREGVGRVIEGDALSPGARVYFDRGAALAERAVVDEATAIELPEYADDALAASLGVAGLAAWLALERHARVESSDCVVVLGASGAVGQIGVQAARLLGAARVVAAARDERGLERARELGADATVSLVGEIDEIATALRDAAGRDISVVLDPLWGDPAVAAATAAGFRARFVNIGQSAGPQAALRSLDVRNKELRILGHTNFATTPAIKRETFERLLAHALAGELRIDYEELALERVADAWERQASSPHRKLVLRP